MSPHPELERRLNMQQELDTNISASERNRLGQFATPPALAWDILRLAKRYSAPDEKIRFLDPGIGTGVFFSALLDVFGSERVQEAVGFEVDEKITAIAQELWSEYGLRVRGEDFTSAAAPETERSRFTLIVCNPPYVRHHHLDTETKTCLKQIIEKTVGLSVNGLSGLYCYFMLLADKWLANNGIALWLIPAEFLDVNYGSILREYLSDKVMLHRIHRFDPRDVQFFDALVSSCVVVFEKRRYSPRHIVHLSSGGRLLEPKQTRLIAVHELRQSSKWGQLIDGNVDHPKIGFSSQLLTVGDIFDVKRGIATGANSFFILESEKAKNLRLPMKFLKPILPGPRYIHTDTIEADQRGYPREPPQLVLLDCDLTRQEIKESYPELDAYLISGEEDGLTNRYLLKKRNPWFKQEDRPPAPILFKYMSRQKRSDRSSRFLRNLTEATATNVYLMLYPKPWLHEIGLKDPGVLDRIFLALQELSNEELLGAGRTYGGGLNKLEPRELAAMQLALCDGDSERLRQNIGLRT